ncbi:MAG TPA: cupredoxin domain-containing protein [bacterium]|nr:cupredoxin domain-containing protein [bacterium]
MRNIVVVVVVAVMFGVAGCGGGGDTSQPTPAPEQPAGQAPAPSAGGNVVAVKMSEFKFEMQPSQIAPGKVSFEIENVGTVEHSFIIEELGVKSEEIRPGQKATVTVDARAGTYTAICDVVGHKEAGMTSQLTVK